MPRRRLSDRRTQRFLRALHPYRSTVGMLLTVVLLSGLWVGVRGLLVLRDLKSAQANTIALEAAAGDGRAGEVGALERQVRGQAHRADERSHDLVWKVWTRVPFVGSPLKVMAVISAQVDDLATDDLPGLVEASQAIHHLRRPDGTLDVAPLARLAPVLERSADSLAARADDSVHLPSTHFHIVNRRRVQYSQALSHLAYTTRALATAAGVSTELFGMDGSRRYLVAVQNLAESRASGGIVGAYGVLDFDRGRASLEQFGDDSLLEEATSDAIDFGPEWRERYEVLGQARDWRETTATPDFPTAARAMLALWKRQHEESLDGVLSVDSIALEHVLRAIGPVESSQGELVAERFVERTLSQAYARFPSKAERSHVLSASASAIFHALVSRSVGAGDLSREFGEAVASGHLKLYSANVPTQARLARTAIAGSLPVSAPALGIVTQDGNADKLTYYLHRRISYTRLSVPDFLDFGDGKGPQRQEAARVKVTLTNGAPPRGLPDYVAPDKDLGTGDAIRRGQMRILLSLYTGAHGTVDSVVVDGRPAPFQSQSEKGLSVFSVTVSIEPGTSSTIQMVIRQPSPGDSVLQLFRSPTVVQDTLDFAGIPVQQEVPLVQASPSQTGSR